MKDIIIGIDEVGRGPIAGPVAVGAVAILDQNARKIFKGIKDSKQLSEKQREEWFSKIEKECLAGHLKFSVTFQSHKIVDRKGINYAIRTALKISLDDVLQGLKSVNLKDVKILLDGGLRAPDKFVNQKTIIKGDEKIQVIALASVCAKVIRDRYMKSLAKKYPHYNFDVNKGYGTRGHYKAINKHGLCPYHRLTYLQK